MYVPQGPVKNAMATDEFGISCRGDRSSRRGFELCDKCRQIPDLESDVIERAAFGSDGRGVDGSLARNPAERFHVPSPDSRNVLRGEMNVMAGDGGGERRLFENLHANIIGSQQVDLCGARNRLHSDTRRLPLR